MEQRSENAAKCAKSRRVRKIDNAILYCQLTEDQIVTALKAISSHP